MSARLPGVCAFVLALTTAALADRVYLTDGTVVEGEVTYAGDKVRIRQTSGITVTHPRRTVRRVVKSVSAAEEYRKRAESVEPDDAEGLLGLARWCVEKKLDTEAEQAYRAVLGVASPVYRRAKREFAGLLERGNRLKEAHRLYTELGPEAANDAAVVNARLDRQRAAAYEKGKERLLAGNRREALLEFVRALKYTPAGAPARTGMVTESEVLETIVRVRKELVDSTRPPAVDMRVCPACSGSGLEACGACGGAGKIRKQMMVLTVSGPSLEWRWARCEVCRGSGKSRCGPCCGSSVDCSGLGPTKSAVRSIAEAALSSAKGSPSGAARRMNKAAMKRRIDFGPSPAPYPAGHDMRDLLPGVPATSSEFDVLRAVWRGAGTSRRLNFLANYGLDAARLLSFFSESAHKEPADAARLGLDEAEPGDASRISAFPHEVAGDVFRIPCVWKDVGSQAADGAGDELPTGDEFRIPFTVETGRPHTLGPFVWRETAEAVMKRLADVYGLPGLATRAARYPFRDLALTVEARKPGDRIELVGRLLHDSRPAQTWRFEVWRIGPRPDEETERVVAMLSREVSFRFSKTPLAAAMEMLQDLTGARIRLEVPADAGFEVTARARKVPLGHALDRMLTKLDLTWTLGSIDVGSVRVVERLRRAERTRVREILRLVPEAGE